MRHRATIGIEIASGEVRGALIRSAGGGVELMGVASAPLSPAGKDGSGLLNVQEVSDAVRRVCSKFEARSASVVFGLTDCSQVARVVEIPPVPDAEVRSVLRGEMDYYRILPAGQSSFDYFRLPDPEDREPDGGEESVRVLLIGAEDRLVASYRAVADTTNLSLLAVEPGAIAALRALYPSLLSEKAVATVMLSSAGTDVLITHEGALQFFRRIDTGLQELYTREASHESEPSEQPRGHMLGGGEPEASPAAKAPADKFNRQAITLLMTEVQRSIDYFAREYPSAGGKVAVRFIIGREDDGSLFGALSQSLRSQAEIASPFDRLAVASEAAEAVRGPQGSRYTVAVGLALRGCGGDYAQAPALDLGVGDRVIVDRRMAPKLVLVSSAVSGFVLVGTVAAALLVGTRIADTERTLKQTKHELEALTREHAARVARLERQKGLVAAIHNADRPIREGVEYLSASISRRACLTSVAIDPKGGIVLNGEAASPQAVADIMDSINLSPALDPVRLDNISRLDPTGAYTAVSFQMETAFAATPAESPAAPASNSDPTPQGGQ